MTSTRAAGAPVAQGVPLVAIPIGYEQPGIAARIAYHQGGKFIEIDELNAQSFVGIDHQSEQKFQLSRESILVQRGPGRHSWIGRSGGYNRAGVPDRNADSAVIADTADIGNERVNQLVDDRWQSGTEIDAQGLPSVGSSRLRCRRCRR